MSTNIPANTAENAKRRPRFLRSYRPGTSRVAAAYLKEAPHVVYDLPEGMPIGCEPF